jgi:hypothetical protein
MNNIQFHPNVIGWFITIVLFVIGYVFAFIRQNGKNEAHYEELRREIERLTRTDIDLMEKIDHSMERIAEAMQWGRDMLDERMRFNEMTYVRKDYYSACHQQVLDQLAKISSANIDVRLAKIETSQQQILVAIEELKQQRGK